MQSAIIILLPGDHATRADIESALRKHAAAVEIIDLPPAALHAPANDPDELPLWRWFTF